VLLSAIASTLAVFVAQAAGHVISALASTPIATS